MAMKRLVLMLLMLVSFASAVNITINVTYPSSITEKGTFTVVYNATNWDGDLAAVDWIYLNLSNNFTFITAKNHTIAPFTNFAEGTWLVAAPNSTGVYNFSVVIHDSAGPKFFYSPGERITVDSEPSLNLIVLCLMLLASLFAYLFTSSASVIWSRVWIFMCGLIIITSLFISMTFADAEGSVIRDVVRAIFISSLLACMLGFYWLIIEIYTSLIHFLKSSADRLNGKKNH